jgi:hypothetical protein
LHRRKQASLLALLGLTQAQESSWLICCVESDKLQALNTGSSMRFGVLCVLPKLLARVPKAGLQRFNTRLVNIGKTLKVWQLFHTQKTSGFGPRIGSRSPDCKAKLYVHSMAQRWPETAYGGRVTKGKPRAPTRTAMQVTGNTALLNKTPHAP